GAPRGRRGRGEGGGGRAGRRGGDRARRDGRAAADEGDPGGDGAAGQGDAGEKKEAEERERVPLSIDGQRPDHRPSSTRRPASAARTSGQGPFGIRASTVNSLSILIFPRLRVITALNRSGVTGVEGAHVRSARSPCASTRSTPTGRAATRNPTTARSASNAGGGGAARYAS